MPLTDGLPTKFANPVSQNGSYRWVQDIPPTAFGAFDTWYRPGSGREFIWRPSVLQPDSSTTGRWVTQDMYFHHFESNGLSANTNVGRDCFFPIGLNSFYNVYLERLVVTARVASGVTDATNFWTLNYEKTGVNSVEVMHSLQLKTLTASAQIFNAAPGKEINESTNTTLVIWLRCAKTGTAPNLLLGTTYQYRLIYP